MWPADFEQTLQIELDELVADGRGGQHAQVGEQQGDERGRRVVDHRVLLVEVPSRLQGVRFILEKKTAIGDEAKCLWAARFKQSQPVQLSQQWYWLPYQIKYLDVIWH